MRVARKATAKRAVAKQAGAEKRAAGKVATKRVAPAKKAVAKTAVPAKNAVPLKKAVPAKKAPPAKKAVAAKKATPAKRAARPPSSTAPASSGPGASAQSELSAVVAEATALGWRVWQLYRYLPKRGRTPELNPAQLNGIGDLTDVQRFELYLSAVDFSLASVLPAITASGAPTAPDTREVHARLASLRDTDGSAQTFTARARELGAAVSQLNDSLLVWLMGGDERIGTAYNLGRSLGETFRSGQPPADLVRNFKEERLAQINAWLIELSTILPAHVGKAVSQSLAWWRDAVYTDLLRNADPKAATPAFVTNTTAPGLLARKKPGKLTRPAAEADRIPNTRFRNPEDKTLQQYGTAFSRQGALWRGLLSGRLDPQDLLTPGDYLDAADRNMHDVTRLAARAIKAFWPAILALSVLFAGLVLGIVFIQHASGGSKIAGIVVSSLAYLGGLWRTAAPRLATLGSHLAGPLWGSQLDEAIAVAITLPPAGTADPSGWSAFLRSAPQPPAGNPPAGNPPPADAQPAIAPPAVAPPAVAPPAVAQPGEPGHPGGDAGQPDQAIAAAP